MSGSVSSAGADPNLDAHAARRLRRRRWAEWRFRAYGVLAVLIAGAALATLLISIVLQSASAFATHRVLLDIPVEAAQFDPDGDGEVDAAGVDYPGLIRTALFAQLPEVRDRTRLRELNRLVHSLNGPRLRAAIERRLPGALGGTVRYAAPLADDLDLFLKGRVYPSRIIAGAAPLTPDGVAGSVSIITAPEALAEVRAAVQTRLARLADQLDAQADLHAAEAAAQEAGGGASATALAQLAQQTRARAAAARAEATARGALALASTGPSVLVRVHGGVVKVERLGAAEVTGRVLVPLQTDVTASADTWSIRLILTPEAERARNKFSDAQAAYALVLQDRGVIAARFNDTLFTAATSNEPELAGFLGALVGSLLTMMVAMLLAAPAAVGAAVYLEEFAPQNRFTDWVEININNLAAAPSIVFGLLGAAVFLNFFGQALGLSGFFGRGFPLVGGLVLALMTLPTIIITTRAALRAVPPSVRTGALALGATPLEAVRHHVLPAAMPGILTGVIIGLAQALGETAPLLLIGMAAFVADIPQGFTSAATVMPVQIYQWANKAERAFDPLSAAAILVLLVVLMMLNALAVVLRRHFERRW